jgi:hypothetical protein
MNDTVNPDQRAGSAPRDLEQAPGLLDDEDDGVADADLVRLACPDCGQPIALQGPGGVLPVHALCPTPWNPFGLTVCPGSGRTVSGSADPAAVAPVATRDDVSFAVRATLPEGLDWRLRPFSHAVSPEEMRLPSVRQAA